MSCIKIYILGGQRGQGGHFWPADSSMDTNQTRGLYGDGRTRSSS